MLVYGDQSARADPRERLERIAEQLAAVASMDAGIARHARLICALIDAGRLLQGVADAAFDELGADRRTLTVNALTTWLCRIARTACRSWDTGFNQLGELPDWPGPSSTMT